MRIPNIAAPIHRRKLADPNDVKPMYIDQVKQLFEAAKPLPMSTYDVNGYGIARSRRRFNDQLLKAGYVKYMNPNKSHIELTDAGRRWAQGFLARAAQIDR
jgi:hypothetical protein